MIVAPLSRSWAEEGPPRPPLLWATTAAYRLPTASAQRGHSVLHPLRSPLSTVPAAPGRAKNSTPPILLPERPPSHLPSRPSQPGQRSTRPPAFPRQRLDPHLLSLSSRPFSPVSSSTASLVRVHRLSSREIEREREREGESDTHTRTHAPCPSCSAQRAYLGAARQEGTLTHRRADWSCPQPDRRQVGNACCSRLPLINHCAAAFRLATTSQAD